MPGIVRFPSVVSVLRPVAAALACMALGALILSLSGCGFGPPRQVTITLPPRELATLKPAAPSGEFAFYVLESYAPASASELRQFSVCACTGDSTANRGIQIGWGLGMSSFSMCYGANSTSCIKSALKNARTIVVTCRGTALPRWHGAFVELVFK